MPPAATPLLAATLDYFRYASAQRDMLPMAF